MANQKSSGKDFWDIAESISKIISGVVLVVIAFFINQGAQRISRSNEETRIMQTLIEDLTRKDENTRNDIALLVFERHLTERQKNTNDVFDTAYFKNITETIFRQRIFSDSLFSQEASVCYILLAKYDRKLADSILTAFQADRRTDVDTSRFLAASSIRARKPVSESRNKKEAKILSSLNKKICYIQFSNANRASEFEKLRRKFIDTNWITPALEHVPGDYKNTVRFFHPEDEQTAKRAIAITKAVLGINIDFETVAVVNKKNNVPKGQVEVWISN